jgi:hypothetical protein
LPRTSSGYDVIYAARSRSDGGERERRSSLAAARVLATGGSGVLKTGNARRLGKDGEDNEVCHVEKGTIGVASASIASRSGARTRLEVAVATEL